MKGLGRSRQPASRLLGPLRPLPATGPGPGSLAARPRPCSAAAAPCHPCGRPLGAHRGSLPACPARTYPPPARCCARGPAPRSSSARPPSPRSPRLRGAPRARPAPGPRPRPTLPAARTRRTRTRVPAPPPPQRRRLPGRQHCAAAAPGTSPDAPGLQARPGKPLHRRHSATRGRLACGRPEIPRQPTPRPPTRATLIAGNRRPYGGAGPEEGPVAAAPLQVAPRGLVWGRGAASQRRWVLGSSAPPRPHLRPENRGSEQPSESG